MTLYHILPEQRGWVNMHTIWPHKRAAHPVMFKISVGRDPKNPNYIFSGREFNSLCPNGKDSVVCLTSKTQLSAWRQRLSCQLTWFFKILKFSAHLFWAWRHPHSSFISCLGFIMTMVIVISFAHERKLYPMLCTWTLNLNSSKPNQTEW